MWQCGLKILARRWRGHFHYFIQFFKRANACTYLGQWILITGIACKILQRHVWPYVGMSGTIKERIGAKSGLHSISLPLLYPYFSVLGGCGRIWNCNVTFGSIPQSQQMVGWLWICDHKFNPSGITKKVFSSSSGSGGGGFILWHKFICDSSTPS